MLRSRRPAARYSVSNSMYKKLVQTIEQNHNELTELRTTAEANFRRVAELQVEVDRLKKLLVTV